MPEVLSGLLAARIAQLERLSDISVQRELIDAVMNRLAEQLDRLAARQVGQEPGAEP